MNDKIFPFDLVREWREREEFKSLIVNENEESKAKSKPLFPALKSLDSNNQEINMILSVVGFVSGDSIQVPFFSILIEKDSKSAADILIRSSLIKSLNVQRMRII